MQILSTEKSYINRKIAILPGSPAKIPDLFVSDIGGQSNKPALVGVIRVLYKPAEMFWRLRQT
jgi:hypothetical protein